MNKYVYGGLLFCLLAIIFFTCRERIQPGYVGVKINYWGSSAGVSPDYVREGVVFYVPMVQNIEQYPTYEHVVNWTKEITPESPTDESIVISDKNGAVISADLALSLKFIPEKVPVLYQRTRKTHSEIIHSYLRILVRGKINRETEKLDIVQIFGEERSKMLDRALKSLNSDLEGLGIVIDTMDFQGELRVSESVKSSIERVIVARQQSIEAEQKVKQIMAEADQAKAKAEGDSEAILINAKKQAEANNVLTQSLTPELIKYKAVEKWDGVLPRVSGDAVPLIDVGDLK